MPYGCHGRDAPVGAASAATVSCTALLPRYSLHGPTAGIFISGMARFAALYFRK